MTMFKVVLEFDHDADNARRAVEEIDSLIKTYGGEGWMYTVTNMETGQQQDIDMAVGCEGDGCDE